MSGRWPSGPAPILPRACEGCGETYTPRRDHVARQRFCSRSCAGASNVRASHRMSKSREWNTWAGMKARCYSEGDPSFHRYGGRGIRICDRWLHSFAAFLDDMGRRPPGTTLDRIDNDGDYEPGNCRWATALEQQGGRSTSKRLEFRGRTQTIAAWARELGISDITLGARLGRYGWSVERALTAPVGPRRRP